MATTIASDRQVTPLIPWYIWCAAFALTSVMLGGHWDISWHSSIGRDTFWNPAHMAIYLGGLLSGVAFGFLIFYTTFSKGSPLRGNSVHIWGFTAPLGAFLASWGGVTMLASAPFDIWWHSAYGLDTRIISPPHIVLFIGIYAIYLGAMVLMVAHANMLEKQASEKAKQVRWLFLYVTGVLLTMVMVMLIEVTERPKLHSSTAYIVLATLTPGVFALGIQVSRLRFAATFMAAIYTLTNIALIQILPLFPAEPKLGPVHQHVTSFIPPAFPVLMIVPAIVMDALWVRTPGSWSAWKVALVGGLMYVPLLIIPEWYFAIFLNTPAAANRFFGTIYLYFSLPPESFAARRLFDNGESTAHLWLGFTVAALAAVVSIRCATACGKWMSSIQR